MISTAAYLYDKASDLTLLNLAPLQPEFYVVDVFGTFGKFHGTGTNISACRDDGSAGRQIRLVSHKHCNGFLPLACDFRTW